MSRVAALWFPDWPAQAIRLERGEAAGEPGLAALAVVSNHRVVVCDGQARRLGVRRGMRVRQAQAVCPELDVVDANPERDGVVFAAIADCLDDVASSVEVLRPGMVIVDAGAAGRFHGSEDNAVEMLIDATARAGVDTVVGVADELATALIAARYRAGTVVPAGLSRQFLEAQPVGVLAAETSLEVDKSLVEQLLQLGVCHLGQLAALPGPQVATRFGAAGMRAHRIALATADRRVAPELPTPDLAVAMVPEEPIERVDAAAFAARQLAAVLHGKLARAGLSCVRLQVVAELAGGVRLERVWRTREALDEQATADRVRWQLDGWLSQARAAEASGIVRLELIPIATARPAEGELFGASASDEGARRVIARVQSQLGTDRVLSPRAAGGRGIAERIELVPYGEQRDPAAQGSWPGQIPAPLPARLGAGVNHPAARLRLVDAAGRPIHVTAEALLSGEPFAVAWGKQKYRVAGWAGPWPVDVGWWSGASDKKVARMQLVGWEPGESIQRAWLLLWQHGAWRVEAAYF